MPAHVNVLLNIDNYHFFHIFSSMEIRGIHLPPYSHEFVMQAWAKSISIKLWYVVGAFIASDCLTLFSFSGICCQLTNYSSHDGLEYKKH